MPNTPRTAFRLEPDLVDQVDARAAALGIDRTAFVRQAIVDALGRTETPARARRQRPSVPSADKPSRQRTRPVSPLSGPLAREVKTFFKDTGKGKR